MAPLRVPDWTYHPLNPLAAGLLGRSRAHRAALRSLACLTRLPGGAGLIALFLGRFHAPEGIRVGAAVPAWAVPDAGRVLPLLGAHHLEVNGLAPEPGTVRIGDPDPGIAAAKAGSGLIAVTTTENLVAAGPGWFRRVLEAATPVEPPLPWRGADPRRWPSWAWGVLVGLGMIGGGLGAAAITLGPLLLWYDRDYLGMDRDALEAVSPHLVRFLQHDRITMAGTMVAIGILYTGLAHGGIRRGWIWARDIYLVSGLIGFPTLFYFLSTGFVEPLHTAVTMVLFPPFLLAVRRSPRTPRWRIMPEGPGRNRALTGQLLMILVGLGLLVGGAVVSSVGLNEVFVPTDLTFLDIDPHHLHAAGSRLVPFIAHDRAGFGGALMAAAAAITLLAMWGWRRGEAWVWWTLLAAATSGFAPTMAVHLTIHYTTWIHLAPVYTGITLTSIALALSRPYLCARQTEHSAA